MQRPRPEAWKVGGDNPATLTNQAVTGCSQANSQSSPNAQEASIRSLSHRGSGIPYPFESQLEHEDGSRGMCRSTNESIPRS